MRKVVRDAHTETVEKLTAAMQKIFRDSQTEILRAFSAVEQNWDLRFASLEDDLNKLKSDLANFNQTANGRLGNIEKHLMAVKDKFLSNPQQQQ